ncbi:MAG: hypothetical protein HQK51_13030 [Oligoflexia bacterium]|nr:hypothetical protein [Oligoflexia bacterium]
MIYLPKITKKYFSAFTFALFFYTFNCAFAGANVVIDAMEKHLHQMDCSGNGVTVAEELMPASYKKKALAKLDVLRKAEDDRKARQAPQRAVERRDIYKRLMKVEDTLLTSGASSIVSPFGLTAFNPWMNSKRFKEIDEVKLPRSNPETLLKDKLKSKMSSDLDINVAKGFNNDLDTIFTKINGFGEDRISYLKRISFLMEQIDKNKDKELQKKYYSKMIAVLAGSTSRCVDGVHLSISGLENEILGGNQDEDDDPITQESNKIISKMVDDLFQKFKNIRKLEENSTYIDIAIQKEFENLLTSKPCGRNNTFSDIRGTDMSIILGNAFESLFGTVKKIALDHTKEHDFSKVAITLTRMEDSLKHSIAGPAFLNAIRKELGNDFEMAATEGDNNEYFSFAEDIKNPEKSFINVNSTLLKQLLYRRGFVQINCKALSNNVNDLKSLIKNDNTQAFATALRKLIPGDAKSDGPFFYNKVLGSFFNCGDRLSPKKQCSLLDLAIEKAKAGKPEFLQELLSLDKYKILARVKNPSTHEKSILGLFSDISKVPDPNLAKTLVKYWQGMQGIEKLNEQLKGEKSIHTIVTDFAKKLPYTSTKKAAYTEIVESLLEDPNISTTTIRSILEDSKLQASFSSTNNWSKQKLATLAKARMYAAPTGTDTLVDTLTGSNLVSFINKAREVANELDNESSGTFKKFLNTKSASFVAKVAKTYFDDIEERLKKAETPNLRMGLAREMKGIVTDLGVNGEEREIALMSAADSKSGLTYLQQKLAAYKNNLKTLESASSTASASASASSLPASPPSSR